MKKIKSIIATVAIMLVTMMGLSACHHQGKCHKQMCCTKECCKKCDGKECCGGKDCKEKCEKMCSEGKCCKKDSAACMKDMDGKKACCARDSMKGMEGKKACCAKDSKTSDGMYHCPMHKDVTSDKPGKCTKCGMDMEKTK